MLTVLATSASSGVVAAVQTAAKVSGRAIELMTASNIPREVAGGALAVPATADPAFGPVLLGIVEVVRPDLVVASRDEDALAIGLLEIPIAALGAAVTATGEAALRGSFDKAITEDTFRPAIKANGDALVRIARTATDMNGAQSLLDEHGAVIVKPRFGCASRGVSLIEDPRTLTECFNPSTSIAQEAIPSAEADTRPWDRWWKDGAWGERSYQLVVAKSGELLGSWASVNVLHDGRPTFVDRIDGPLVEAHVDHLHQMLVARGAAGIWNVQAKLAKETAVVFEVNGRMTGITGVRAADGFDELGLVLAAMRHDADAASPATGHLGPGTYDCRDGYPGVPIVSRQRAVR